MLPAVVGPKGCGSYWGVWLEHNKGRVGLGSAMRADAPRFCTASALRACPTLNEYIPAQYTSLPLPLPQVYSKLATGEMPTMREVLLGVQNAMERASEQ